MRHTLALLLALCLVMAGCGGSEPVPVPEQRLAKPIDELCEQLCEDYALPQPMSIDSELLEQLFGIAPEQAAGYAGYMSMDSNSPDHLVAVQALPECSEEVAQALEARRALLLDAYAGSPEALLRVQAGQVVFRGDFVFLVIAAREGQQPTDEVADIIAQIEDNFEK